MSSIILAKDVGKVLADAINKELAKLPNDKVRKAALEAFSKQMFYGKAQEK